MNFFQQRFALLTGKNFLVIMLILPLEPTNEK